MTIANARNPIFRRRLSLPRLVMPALRGTSAVFSSPAAVPKFTPRREGGCLCLFGVRYMRDCPPLPAGRSPKGRGGRTKIFRLFEYERDARSIKAESDFDGICVTRISLAAEELGAENCVRVCKSLRTVGRAFRTLKTGHLEVRPIHRRPSAGASVLAHAGLPCRVAHVRGMGGR